ncbi:MAG: transcription termination/antitermination protein NusA [Lachnospiraceae bacterium]|nr:transcription termination/antitermination protein NusA [Lachnospiraceae bacterium]
MSAELKEAIEAIAKEKNISKDALLDGIELSLLQACKNHFGKADNVVVEIDRDTCDYEVYANKEVVETVEDPAAQLSLFEAKKIDEKYELGDIVRIPIQSKAFGRIATQNAKNVILQKIREEERRSLFDRYYEREHQIVSGTVSRINGRTIAINLGKADGILTESEMVKSENLRVHDRVKVYVVEVKDSPKGPRILVSRSHPELVKKLFESEVSELAEGIIEIKAIAREAGSRTKMAVCSNDPDVDAVGACVGMNGIRVGAVVDELGGEKVDIINWDENPALLIENALSPAKVISVLADPDDRTALVIVPDYQLSLAIGKEGQNARLAAKLTGFKIDIKSETQAQEAGIFEEYFGDDDEEEYEEYEEASEEYAEDEEAAEASEDEESADEEPAGE